MEIDFDFVCEYLEKYSHEKNILDRIKSEILEKEDEIQKIELDLENSDKKIDEIENFEKIEIDFDENGKIDKNLENTVFDIRQSQKAINYQLLIQHIKEIHEKLNSLSRENMENAIPEFQKLKEISSKCSKSSCLKLKTFLDEVVKSWHFALKLEYENQIDSELARIGFPFSNGNINLEIDQIKECLVKLEELDLPSHLKDESDPPLPIKALIRPLKKKFKIYFYSSSSKLNDPTKPEYYLSVILKWLIDNKRFLQFGIEELFQNYSSFYQFSSNLVKLGNEKVKNDLRNLTDDDILSHFIDEILSNDFDLIEFEPELVNSKRPIYVIQNDQNLIDRWLKLEIIFARESMDDIINNESFWINKSDIAALKFFEIIQLTTRRCRRLNQSVKLQFFIQQLEIVDEFRLALHQISDVDRISHERVCSILNTVNCIHSSLSLWEERIPYNRMLQISTEFQSRHDTVIRNLLNLADSLSNTLVLHSIEDIQFGDGALQGYRDVDFGHIRESEISEVSNNFIPILSKVQIHLQQFESGLLDFVYRNILKKFATGIDKILTEEVFEKNRSQFEMNRFGIEQIKKDIFDSLFPLFQTLIPNPNLLFPRLDSVLKSFISDPIDEMDFC